MNKNDVKKFFETFGRKSTLQRIDASHPLDIYLGLSDEGLKTLFVFSKYQFSKIKSSKGIIVTQYKKEEENILTFKLNDKSIEDLFYVFCNDIIESTRFVQKINGNSCIVNRYSKWRELFAKQKLNILLESEIKGLVGEILFLTKYMVPNYGEEKAVGSWLGTMGADQDFIIEDTWYEVKSTSSGAGTIKISSLEQLDTENQGFLIVNELNQTSEISNNAITLNKLIEDTKAQFVNVLTKQNFEDILFNFGYIRDDEYDKYCYELKKMKKYLVNNDFPRLRRRDISQEIISIKYELSISEIEQFYEGDIA